jgi:hypothetical protein
LPHKLNHLPSSVGDLIYEATTKIEDLSLVESLLNDAKKYLEDSVQWKKVAALNLGPQLEEYDAAIKNTIGIRSQDRLNKNQAIEIAKCSAKHRDIALRF